MSNFELENVNIEPEVDEDKIPLNGSPPIDTTKHIIIVIFMVFFFAILLGLIISLFIWGITFIFRFKQTNKQQYVFIIGDWVFLFKLILGNWISRTIECGKCNE